MQKIRVGTEGKVNYIEIASMSYPLIRVCSNLSVKSIIIVHALYQKRTDQQPVIPVNDWQ